MVQEGSVDALRLEIEERNRNASKGRAAEASPPFE